MCISIYRTWVGDSLRKLIDVLVKFKLSIRFSNCKNKGKKKQVPRWKGQVELARSKAEFLVVGCEEGRDFQGERWIERQECSFCRRMFSSIIGL